MKKIVLFVILLLAKTLHSQSANQDLLIDQNEKDYLRNFVFPLHSYEPEIGFKEDSLVFNRFFSNVKIIGLGEASHGSSEIFKIKDKLTRYILQRNHVGIFSIEASMPNSFLLNEYIINGNKTGKEYLMNIKSWIYQTDEILSMIEWMKQTNDKNTQKIRFTGFDNTTYIGSMVQLKILLDKYKIPIDDLLVLSQNLSDFNKLPKNQLLEKKRIQSESLTRLNKIKAFSSSISDEDDKSWFLQHLTLLNQYLYNSYLDRNRYMAENILWLKNKYPESVFVLWAHNEHIKKTGEETGKFLKEKLKDDYINCGTLFYEGFHSVVDLKDENVKPINLEKNSKNSLEELLNSFDIPIFILDLKNIKKENNKLAQKLLTKINYRTVGAAVHKKDFKSGNISEDFDYIIFIKKSTASKLLSKY
ncbi:erythromycin esterase family protein [Chryseobacterium luquanense]|uniref:Erythromycin esterase family protein n=1 Tax=Chryseobacterium luquanense TaxID=2983766 RepID=A0ABT3XYH1_9FLAO|nr:erythromycin esterase family protein [Chryseobacterium luquanense]MCX8530933.1 erythromycin esterase family protein [Chryseobacterium luquanense]